MHPEVMLDIVKLHIEDLHREAAQARLAAETSRRRSLPNLSSLWSGLGVRKVLSRTA